MADIDRNGANERQDWHLAVELDRLVGTDFGTLAESDPRDMQLAVEQSEWFQRARSDAFAEGVEAARGRDTFSVIVNPYVQESADVVTPEGNENA